MNWQGLAAIAKPLEAFLARGGVVQSLFGVDNGVTTPDALIYSLYLKERFTSYRLAAVVPWRYSDSKFHPKCFQFDFEDHSVMLLGSANLTGGGILRNHEATVELKVSRDDPFYPAIRRAWRKYARHSQPITRQLIRNLVESEQLARERTRAEARK